MAIRYLDDAPASAQPKVRYLDALPQNPQQSQPQSYGSDMLETGLPAFFKMGNTLAGMPGDMSQLARTGINWAGKKLGAEGDVVAPQSPTYPTSQQYQGALEKHLGFKLYEPKYLPAKIEERTIVNAPAAIGVEGVLPKLATTLGSAVTGLGAREGAKAAGASPGWQTAADIAGSLVAPGAASKLTAPGASLEEMKTAARDLFVNKENAYTAVDNLGARYSAKQLTPLLDDMRQTITKKAVRGSDNRAFSMLDDMNEGRRLITQGNIRGQSGTVPLTQLDKFRQQIDEKLIQPNLNPIKGNDLEKSLGWDLKRKIDRFVEDTNPAILPPGVNPTEVSKAIRAARAAHRKFKQQETLTYALHKAEQNVGPSGHFRTKLTGELKKIVQDPNRSRGFDQKQLRKLESTIGARGTPGYYSGQAARVLGSLAPTEPWGAAIHGALGLGTGGSSLLAQAPVAGLGLLAKRFGDTSVERGLAGLSRQIQGLPPQSIQYPWLLPATAYGNANQ